MRAKSINHTHHRLANGTDVLCIEVADEQKSALAISIACGHFYDDEDCPGLAHLLEHMLFMGTTQNGSENHVVTRIEQLGGQLNAVTGTEYMTIQCKFPSDKFSSVVEILHTMLSQPLFDETGIEKEVATIDAEFQYKRKDDLRRLYQVHKETCNPEHPFSRFSVGNAEVFGRFEIPQLIQKLRTLHQRRFIAPLCKITLLSSIPSEEVKTAFEHFLPVGDNPSPSLLELPALYNASQKGVMIGVQSLSEARRLIITFALDGMQPTDIEALGLISHLLGDEGQGSILAVLKSANWLVSLSAGGGIEGRNFKDFNLNMQLTPQGEAHIDDIVHCVMHYINLITQCKDFGWRIEEKRQLNDIQSGQIVVTPDVEIATQLAQGLFTYSSQTLLSLHFDQLPYTSDDVNKLLAHFDISNLRIKYINHQQDCDHIAQWYETPYCVSVLSTKQMNLWRTPHSTQIELDTLQLPQRNPYIQGPEQSQPQTTLPFIPEQRFKTENYELWVAADPLMDAQRADAYVSLECPANAKGTDILAAKRVWLSCLNDTLQEKYYAAEVAGLNYRLYGHQGGLSIHTSGLAYKQQHLMQALLADVLHVKDFKGVFDRVKTMQCATLRNNLLNKPVNRLFTRLGVLLQRHSHAPSDVLTALEALTYEEMISHRQSLLHQRYIQSFLHGAWTDEDVNSTSTIIAQHSKDQSQVEIVARDVAHLTPSRTYFHAVESHHDDAAALLFLQAPSNTIQDTALTMIFEQLLASPFFNDMRTRKQLGYVVGSGFVSHNSYPGMVFFVQSPTHNANTLVIEITQFLMTQLNNIDYYRQYWPQIQMNIVRQLQSPDVNSSARAQRLWLSMGMKEANFNHNQEIANFVKQIKFEQLIEHARALQRRQSFGEMVLYCHGSLSPDMPILELSNSFIIEDSDTFKSTISYK
ncbi:insulinase family protein [Alteromonas facilis]|uniref:insulinase family protein n=1 Tax=Alteromonas facilis TaxID=2048004 RepID=UPI000C287ACA|nr:insulinase family protein [Alteromonas facilis]